MINRWRKGGNCDRFYFLGLQNHSRWWLQPWNKRHLFLGRRAMTNLDSLLKSKDITLLTKVHRVKAMIFPVVIYGRESWTIKKAELQRIDAFKLWCWRWLLRVHWTARRSNQSILKESTLNIHWKDWYWNVLQYFGHPMWTADLLEKTLMLGKTEDRMRSGAAEDEMVRQHHWLSGHEFGQTLGDRGNRGAWQATVHGVTKSRTWLSDWIRHPSF